MTANTARNILVFITLMLSVGVNVGQHALQMFNLDRNYLVLTLVAIVVAGLLAHRHLFFVVLVCGLTLAINLPQEMLVQYYINPDILFTTLIALIVAPAAAQTLGLSLSTRSLAR